MKKILPLLFGLLTMVSPVMGQSINANAKATFQTSYTALLKPFSASTGGSGPITSPWSTVLEQSLKTANNWDLVITPSFEVGLLTRTSVSSRNMVIDTSTATAAVKVRVLVDGAVAPPGEVVYGKRTQQLSAQLEGAIASCLSIITNASGALTVSLDTNCVAPETISLLNDSTTASSFTFGIANLPTGVHLVQVQAQISAMGDNQNGTFSAAGLLGKGTMTAESSRLVKSTLGNVVVGGYPLGQ